MEQATSLLEETLVKKIESKVKGYYESNDPGHDWNHVLRVVSLCKKMMGELRANERVLIPAALLHDMVCLPRARRAAADRPRLVPDQYVERDGLEQLCALRGGLPYARAHARPQRARQATAPRPVQPVHE